MSLHQTSLYLIQDHKFQDYGLVTRLLTKKNHNNIINPLSWKINIFLTALWYWNQSLKQIGNWTFLMILIFSPAEALEYDTTYTCKKDNIQHLIKVLFLKYRGTSFMITFIIKGFYLLFVSQ